MGNRVSIKIGQLGHNFIFLKLLSGEFQGILKWSFIFMTSCEHTGQLSLVMICLLFIVVGIRFTVQLINQYERSNTLAPADNTDNLSACTGDDK